MYFYPFNVRDYLTKTRHLNLLEDLAYRRCLDCYYTEEAPLPKEPERVARLIAMPDNVQEVELVLREFFELSDEAGAMTAPTLRFRRTAHVQNALARTGSAVAASQRQTQQEPSRNPVGCPTLTQT